MTLNEIIYMNFRISDVKVFYCENEKTKIIKKEIK